MVLKYASCQLGQRHLVTAYLKPEVLKESHENNLKSPFVKKETSRSFSRGISTPQAKLVLPQLGMPLCGALAGATCSSESWSAPSAATSACGGLAVRFAALRSRRLP